MPVESYPQLGIEAVVVMGAAIAVSILLMFTPLFYPFRLLSTTVHELGHAFATRLTGGEVKGLRIFFRQQQDGTLAYVEGEGGDPRFVIPAGHLGTAIFGAALIMLSGLPYAARYTLAFLGGFLILIVLLYGRSFSTFLIGLILGLGFIWVAWRADLIWTVFLLFLLAVQAVIRTFADLMGLAGYVRQNPKRQDDDASKMAQVMGCTPWFWIRTWFLLSILILATAFWFVWLRPLEWRIG